MSKKKLLFVKFLWAGVAFAILGSAMQALFRVDPGPIAPLTSLLIQLLFVVLAWRAFFSHNLVRSILAMVSVLAIGFGSEWLGLMTGLPFGRYEYTDRWFPIVQTLQGPFPVQLPFAWAMTVAACLIFVPEKKSIAHRAVLAATLAMLANIPMEWANHMTLRYWVWTDPTWPLGSLPFPVPLLNSIGWWVTAFLGAMVLQSWFRPTPVDREAGGNVLLAQTTLMLGLGLVSLLPSLR